MAARRCCPRGHPLASTAAASRRCGPCRVDALVAVVAAACPELSVDQVGAAVEATITSPAVARELTAVFEEVGAGVLAAGAPPVVGRLVGELAARGSSLAAPACAVCGRTGRPLTRVGTTGVCPRCRSHQLAQACSGCGRVRVVVTRGGDDAALCFACSPRPARPCGRCGRVRPIARRASNGEGDICVSCFRPPVATCGSCGLTKPCNFRRSADLCGLFAQGDGRLRPL